MGWLQNFFKDLLGEGGKAYIPYLMTVALFLAVSNLIGLLGFKTAHKGYECDGSPGDHEHFPHRVCGLSQKGAKGFLKSFAEPVPVVLPINILEIFIKPVSLCMRLFGNILGSFCGHGADQVHRASDCPGAV